MDVHLVPPPEHTATTPSTGRRSPVRPPCLDYDPADYQIRPCERCGTWWAEIVRDPTGRQVVREWHNPSCPTLLEWE